MYVRFVFFLIFSLLENSSGDHYSGYTWGITNSINDSSVNNSEVNVLKTIGNSLYAGYTNGVINIWDISNESNYSIINSFHDSLSPVSSIILLTSNDTSVKIASGDQDGIINIWTLNGTHAVGIKQLGNSTIDSAVYSLVELDNGLVVSSGADSFIKVYNVSMNESEALQEEVFSGHNGSILAMVMVRGYYLVTGGEDMRIKVWNSTSSNNITEMYSMNSTSKIHSLASLSGVMVAAGGSDGTLTFWDTVNGRLVYTIYAHQSSVYSLLRLRGNPAENSVYLASGANDSTVQVYMMRNELVATLVDSSYDDENQLIVANRSFISLAQFPNHNIGAICREDDVIRIWNFTHVDMVTTTTTTTTITTNAITDGTNSTIVVITRAENIMFAYVGGVGILGAGFFIAAKAWLI